MFSRCTFHTRHLALGNMPGIEPHPWPSTINAAMSSVGSRQSCLSWLVRHKAKWVGWTGSTSLIWIKEAKPQGTLTCGTHGPRRLAPGTQRGDANEAWSDGYQCKAVRLILIPTRFVQTPRQRSVWPEAIDAGDTTKPDAVLSTVKTLKSMPSPFAGHVCKMPWAYLAAGRP